MPFRHFAAVDHLTSEFVLVDIRSLLGEERDVTGWRREKRDVHQAGFGNALLISLFDARDLGCNESVLLIGREIEWRFNRRVVRRFC